MDIYTLHLNQADAIDAIIEAEWNMFHAVNSQHGDMRASCQDDYHTFQGMRQSQFAAWSHDAVESYLIDLLAAQEEGRNLVEEKYLFMMILDDPENSQALLPAVKMPSKKIISLAEALLTLLMEQTQSVRSTYPALGERGRPLTAETSSGSQQTSIQTYQLGELLTYSETTLEKLLAHVRSSEDKGVNLVEEILLNEMRFYGFSSLSKAEEAAKRHLK